MTTDKFDPSAEAPNAAKLGGIDASGFIQGTGQIDSNHVEVVRPAAGSGTNDPLLTIGSIQVIGKCDGNTGNARFALMENGFNFIKLWLDDAATGLTVVIVDPGPPAGTAFEAADRVIAQWVENSQLVTLTLTAQGGGSLCIYNAQAVRGAY